jgi:HAE1 family hydrophobic/amphiphilic exporter-1
MSLAELSIKRPIFVTCIVLSMLVIGWASFKSLSVDLFPDVNFPVITVTTRYPGAGPAEIETLISKPMEDEISTISGLKRLTSKSLEGVSQVTAEFHLETDVKYAEQEVRDKVSTAKPNIPKEAKEPTIQRLYPSDQPILNVAVSAELQDGKLFDLADQTIKPRLEQVSGVGSVDILGGRKREFQVQVDRKILKARDLSVIGVANQLAAAGQNVPGGKVNEGDKETIFRSMGEFHSTDDIAATLVNMYSNEVPTRIYDIGRVYDTLEDETSRVFVNGKKSLFIEIYRQSGSNTIAVVDGLKTQLTKMGVDLAGLPGHPKLEVIQDGSKDIRANVEDVKETIVLGILLTIIVVYLFLANARSTLITGLALPNSLIGSFILMKIAGFSINVISLLSMSLAVGLLIDDAIVVRENIFRRIEMGENAKKAAIRGTREVQLAVIATTLVVISVFAPVAFMSGVVGQFLKQFGLTVCFAMAISLFDALTIAPMLSTYLAVGSQHGARAQNSGAWAQTVGRVLGGFDRFQNHLENHYEKLLKFTIRRPLVIIIASLGVLLFSFYLVTKIPATFIPDQDNGEFSVELDLPPGNNLDAMNRLSDQADKLIHQNPEVTLTTLTVGGRNGEPNQSSFYVKLVPGKERKRTTQAVRATIRDQLAVMAYANPKVKNYDPTGGAQTQPITFNLITTNQKELEEYSQKILDHMKKDPRLKDVDTTYRPGKPEYQVTTNAKKAEMYGMNTGTIGDEIRAQVEGVTPVKFRENGQEYDIRVRLLPEQRHLGENFNQIYVPNINQRLIRLSDVSKMELREGPATIDRQDRGRYVQLSAALAPGVGQGTILESINHLVHDEMPMPPGMRLSYVGDAENFQEMGTSLVLAFGFAILFIYFVLSSLYESFITPLAIMLALPLALCGAFIALYVTGEMLSLFAILGIVMLLGVACKNSILLVDYTNQLMREGKSRPEALVEACKIRLRPILMTSMALIAGTIPVAIGLTEAAKQRTSMGVAIIGGIISSTLLTLVVVPAAFSYIDRFRVWSGVALARLVGYQTEEQSQDEV